jgi:hypothetical protein
MTVYAEKCNLRQFSRPSSLDLFTKVQPVDKRRSLPCLVDLDRQQTKNSGDLCGFNNKILMA